MRIKLKNLRKVQYECFGLFFITSVSTTILLPNKRVLSAGVSVSWWLSIGNNWLQQ